jgi:hypothetical protein
MALNQTQKFMLGAVGLSVLVQVLRGNLWNFWTLASASILVGVFVYMVFKKLSDATSKRDFRSDEGTKVNRNGAH